MHAIQSDVRQGDTFLALLLATDALLIVGHLIFMVMHLVVWDTPGLLDNIPSDFSIVMERGFAETFQYIKTYWLVLMFLWLAMKTREAGYVAWAVAFLYIGLDDLLEIHEEVGYSISVRYAYPELLGQRPRDLGELTVFAVVATALFCLLAIAYFTGSDRFKHTSRTLIRLVALFALFGIVVDALHIVFLERSAGAFFGLIEDGGESLVLSVIAWHLWQLVNSPQYTAPASRTRAPAQGQPVRHL